MSSLTPHMCPSIITADDPCFLARSHRSFGPRRWKRVNGFKSADCELEEEWRDHVCSFYSRWEWYIDVLKGSFWLYRSEGSSRIHSWPWRWKAIGASAPDVEMEPSTLLNPLPLLRLIQIHWPSRKHEPVEWITLFKGVAIVGQRLKTSIHVSNLLIFKETAMNMLGSVKGIRFMWVYSIFDFHLRPVTPNCWARMYRMPEMCDFPYICANFYC